MEVLAMTVMVTLVMVMFLTRITNGHHDNDDEEDEDNYEDDDNNANHCETDGIVEEKVTAMAGHGGRRKMGTTILMGMIEMLMRMMMMKMMMKMKMKMKMKVWSLA